LVPVFKFISGTSFLRSELQFEDRFEISFRLNCLLLPIIFEVNHEVVILLNVYVPHIKVSFLRHNQAGRTASIASRFESPFRAEVVSKAVVHYVKNIINFNLDYLIAMA
jgi:hypothetical protein